jgi:hypothetical protein
MSANARDAARELFGIDRFQRDWNRAFARAMDGWS